MSINALGGSSQGAFLNPALLQSLYPNLNIAGIQSAFQAELAAAAVPLQDLSSQASGLATQIKAWQALQSDLTALQADAQNLAGTSIYQQVTATSSNTSALTATASGSGNPGTYMVNISRLAQIEIDNSASQSSQTSALNLSGSFTLNGTKVNVASTDTLQTIAADINSAGAGVTATVIAPAGGGYVLNLASTKGAAITWGDPNSILQTLGVLTAGLTPKNQVQAPLAASYTINGVSLSSPTNSDSTTIPGVTLNFLTTTTSAATLSVSENTQSVSAAITQLASDFNKYWNDAATYTGQGGTLEGNAILTGIQAQIATILGGSVSGQPTGYNSLAAIGLSLSAPVGSPNNFSITINGTTLQQQLATNPAAAESLFNRTGGLATQLQNLLQGAVGATGGVTQAIGNLQSQQTTVNQEISDPNSTVNQLISQQQTALNNEFQLLMKNLVSANQQRSLVTNYLNQVYASSLTASSMG